MYRLRQVPANGRKLAATIAGGQQSPPCARIALCPLATATAIVCHSYLFDGFRYLDTIIVEPAVIVRSNQHQCYPIDKAWGSAFLAAIDSLWPVIAIQGVKIDPALLLGRWSFFPCLPPPCLMGLIAGADKRDHLTPGGGDLLPNSLHAANRLDFGDRGRPQVRYREITCVAAAAHLAGVFTRCKCSATHSPRSTGAESPV